MKHPAYAALVWSNADGLSAATRLSLARTSVGYGATMNPSFPYDPDLHDRSSVAGRGGCSWHGVEGTVERGCAGDPVVSFQDRHGDWQSGCQRALEDLVGREEIQPLGQGA